MDSKKSPEAWRSIGEVARDLDLPTHVLRFWESKFTNLKPVKRAGGRRYYRPEDIQFLRALKQLLHGQGYTIKGAREFIKTHGVDAVRAGLFAHPTAAQSRDDMQAHQHLTQIRTALVAARDILNNE